MLSIDNQKLIIIYNHWQARELDAIEDIVKTDKDSTIAACVLCDIDELREFMVKKLYEYYREDNKSCAS